MMKSKLLIALTATLLVSTAHLEAAIVPASPERRSFLSKPAEDPTWATENRDGSDFAIASGGDDSVSAKAEVMKKKKKKKKGKPS